MARRGKNHQKKVQPKTERTKEEIMYELDKAYRQAYEDMGEDERFKKVHADKIKALRNEYYKDSIDPLSLIKPIKSDNLTEEQEKEFIKNWEREVMKSELGG